MVLDDSIHVIAICTYIYICIGVGLLYRREFFGVSCRDIVSL